MKNGTNVVSVAAVIMASIAGVAWAGGDWSSAKSKAEDFKREHQDLRKLTLSETKSLVEAICEAEEDDRKDVSSRAADRARSNVQSKFDQLERQKDAAIKSLEDVVSDDNLKDNHSDARSAMQDVKALGEHRSDDTRSPRREPPGDRVHDHAGPERAQGSPVVSSYCTASEVTLSSGRADCLVATGNDTCTVVELKPDNSRAISKGRDQAARYMADLNVEIAKGAGSDVMKWLIDRNSDFGKCKKFERRVDCYKLCPSVNDEGDTSEPSASWRSDC